MTALLSRPTNPRPTPWLALFAALSFIVFVCPLFLADHIPLLDPDEGLHASIAQEMVERGDWLVPRLSGEPFLDKPILYFWAEAFSLKCFGMNEAAVRLPGMIFGFLGAVTTLAIAWRLFGQLAGMLGGCFYVSMVLPAALTQVPCHDIAMIPWINLTMLCYWQSDRAASRRGTLAWTLAAGCFLGLSVLTKGLTGIALVGTAYGAYLLISRELRLHHILRAGLSLLVAAVIGGSWYVLVEQHIPGFIHYYFFKRHILGFVTDTQPHGGAAWWYYLPFFAVGGLPWIAYLPVTLRDAISRWSRKPEQWQSSPSFQITQTPSDRRIHGRPELYVACWLIVSVMFLSSAHSKLVTYIWPVFPAIAILAALPWSRAVEGSLSEAARRMMGRIVWGTCLIAPAIVPLVFIISQMALPIRVSPVGMVLGCLTGATIWLPLWCWAHGQIRATIVAANLTVVGQLAAVMICVFPQAAATLSAPELSRHINNAHELPTRILLAQERVGSVIFYLNPTLRAELIGTHQIESIDIDDPLPRPVAGPDLIILPERHVHTALNHYELNHAQYEQAGRFRIYRRDELWQHQLIARQNDVIRR